MGALSVAILWHQHQPLYSDPFSGEFLLPWVRLHGVKDYYGMAALLSEFPGVKANINLVPSLLLQLEAVIAGKEDRHLSLSRRPASELTLDEKIFVLNNFFSTNYQKVIAPRKRYADLFFKRGITRGRSVRDALEEFTESDIRDLQVWFNLVWFHPATVAKDEFLVSLIKKGHNFTEQEKERLLARQMDILREVVPLHRSLLESGQVELTTSPFYHPIMPLLCRMDDASLGLPGAPLPCLFESAPEDAEAQISRAVEYHKRVFGRAPEGMWPSEGSVSEAIIPLVVRNGINYLAADEEILAQSLGSTIYPHKLGGISRAEDLYVPYEVRVGDSSARIVFRDHYLSDLIGFVYQSFDPEEAAKDFISHLERIAELTDSLARKSLVTVILDGENAWEGYDNQGVQFLRELYHRLEDNPQIETVRLSDFLKECDSIRPLPRLFPGSWIGHNFGVWVGEPATNRAWDLLGQTRALLKQKQEMLSKDVAQAAWEEIYASEGSDWFWWFSERHHTRDDFLFDSLFRARLKKVYSLLGENPPLALDEPVSTVRGLPFTEPYGLLKVKLDGRSSSYFEWLAAGRYVRGRDGGVMEQVTEHIIKELFFGFDLNNLFIRLDFSDKIENLGGAQILILFVAPTELICRVDELRAPQITIERGGRKSQIKTIAVDRVVEMALPFSELGLSGAVKTKFYVEVRLNKRVERVPLLCPFYLTVPTAEATQAQWQV
jgi:alpha-amylase/alpha-mannosidase (GH57 family)